MAYLVCECEEKLFVKCVRLKSAATGGVVEEHAGWYCFKCGEKGESMKLMARLNLAEKEKEIQRLQQELEDGNANRQAAENSKSKEVAKDEQRDESPGGEAA